jgi:hypothetical protein
MDEIEYAEWFAQNVLSDEQADEQYDGRDA